MDNYTDRDRTAISAPSLPGNACLPVNRCNLPARILGSLTFQRHPQSLKLDAVYELHHRLWSELEQLPDSEQRAALFIDYMRVNFLLGHPEEIGFTNSSRIKRENADYLRLLRGWLFDPDSREGAVFKGWVESRFGLIPRWHSKQIISCEDEAYLAYMHERTSGLYNTNALEAQLDLLYSYCQYELNITYTSMPHLQLYRGFNNMSGLDIQHQFSKNHYVVILNNLNSFSDNEEQAGQFGDYIMQVSVPLSKIAAYQALLPHCLKGEGEYLVLGGVYEIIIA